MNGRHEKSDISVRAVAGFGFALAIVLALILAGVAVFLHPSNHVTLQAAITPPGPQLQAHAREDLVKLHAAEDAVLNGYGWVDRKAGIIRIPIGRAMDLVAQRGLPPGKIKPEVKP